jgi:hypothetical protein
MMTEQEYWNALQARVCAKCVDGNGKGGCFIAKDAECALKKFLPQLVELVNSVSSSSLEPYESLLRKKICGICAHQSPSGECSVRSEVECALDRYFPLILQVMEEVQARGGLVKA